MRSTERRRRTLHAWAPGPEDVTSALVTPDDRTNRHEGAVPTVTRLFCRSHLAIKASDAARVQPNLASHGQRPADLVLVCVKSFDTETAAVIVKPVIGPE